MFCFIYKLRYDFLMILLYLDGKGMTLGKNRYENSMIFSILVQNLILASVNIYQSPHDRLFTLQFTGTDQCVLTDPEIAIIEYSRSI